MKSVSVKRMICFIMFAWGVGGCGVLDAPQEPIEPDSNAGGTSAGSTSGGSSPCDGMHDTWHNFQMCWGRVSGDAGGGTPDDIHTEALRVVAAVEPDISLCERGFPLFPLPLLNSQTGWEIAPFLGRASMVARTTATAPFAAWILEGTEGTRWIVHFAVEGSNPDVLSPGDEVHLRGVFAQYIDWVPRGAIWLERLGLPAVGFAIDVPPAFSGAPDFAIAPGPAACSTQEQETDVCGVWRAVQIEANGESRIVAHHESADVGGFTVFNGRYTALRCDSIVREAAFLLGFYSRR